MWDDISRADAKLLNIRVWFGFVAFSVQIIVIKVLPLVLISLIMNIMPLFTALFGRIFLKERLTPLQSFCLAMSLVGVVIMVTSNKGSSAIGSSSETA